MSFWRSTGSNFENLKFGFLGWNHVPYDVIAEEKIKENFSIFYIFFKSFRWSISIAFFTLSSPGSDEKIDLMTKFGFLGWNDVIYDVIAEGKI